MTRLNTEAWHDRTELPTVFWVWPEAGTGPDPYAADHVDDLSFATSLLGDVFVVAGVARTVEEVAAASGLTSERVWELDECGDDWLERETGYVRNFRPVESAPTYVDVETDEETMLHGMQAWEDAREMLDPDDVALVEEAVGRPREDMGPECATPGASEVMGSVSGKAGDVAPGRHGGGKAMQEARPPRIFGRLGELEQADHEGRLGDEEVADELLSIARQVEDAHALVSPAWELGEYGMERDGGADEPQLWFEGMMGAWEGGGPVDLADQLEALRVLVVGLASTRQAWNARRMVEECAMALGAPSLDAVRRAYPEVSARYGTAGRTGSMGGIRRIGDPATDLLGRSAEEPYALPDGTWVRPCSDEVGSWYAVWTDACQDLCDAAMPCLEAAVGLRARVGGTLLDAPMSYDGPGGSGPGFAMLVMDDASFDAEYAHDESVDCVLDEWLAPDGRVTPELREAANALYEMELEGMRRRRGAAATPSASEVVSRAASRAAQAGGDGLGRDASQGGVGR